MNAPNTLNKLATALAGAYRRQIAKEDHAMLLAQFASLDRELGQPGRAQARIGVAVRQESNGTEDRLEQLWKLPARCKISPK
jgi:hypothetical protein